MHWQCWDGTASGTADFPFFFASFTRTVHGSTYPTCGPLQLRVGLQLGRSSPCRVFEVGPGTRKKRKNTRT